MSTLPSIDFGEIASMSSDAIQTYGTTVSFTALGETARNVKTVIYQDKASVPMVQDSDSTPALALLDPVDFPTTPPRQFDQMGVTMGAYSGLWTLASDPHPIFSGDFLALYICELRRN